MKIGRTVPPAAAPLGWGDLWNGVAGIFSPERSMHGLEEEIRRHFGVGHAYLVSSGTAALAVTLMALKSLSRGTEVVIPAYTCFSVPAAVLKAGLRPVLCDINPSTFDFDHAQLERALTADTLCVVAHHLFGVPSDIEGIRRLCHRRGIFVVEDAAQAMGVQSGGRWLGTIGDAGIFSLGRGKNITCGSGGMIVTSDRRIADAVAEQYDKLCEPTPAEVLKDFVQVVLMTLLIRPRLYWIPASLPWLRLGQTVFPKDVTIARLSGAKAGLLRNWRRRLAGSNRVRSATATYFSEQVPLRLPHAPSHPYLRLPVLAASPDQKKQIYSRSQTRGLGLSAAYPTPISEIPAVRSIINGHRFPAAQAVSEQLLTLPTHHWLSEQDKKAIANLWRDVSSARQP
jgi:perosamine synthetase